MSDYITIPLSLRSKVFAGQYETKVSIEDVDLRNFNWHVRVKPKTQYAQTYKNGKHIAIHRVILERIIGRPLEKGEYVDHRNNDGLDNRRENLRLASNSQNLANRGLNTNNKTGYKGVSWNTLCNKYEAYIRVQGKRKHLGLFDTAEEAHKAYCDAAKEHFGEFARFE